MGQNKKVESQSKKTVHYYRLTYTCSMLRALFMPFIGFLCVLDWQPFSGFWKENVWSVSHSPPNRLGRLENKLHQYSENTTKRNKTVRALNPRTQDNTMCLLNINARHLTNSHIWKSMLTVLGRIFQSLKLVFCAKLGTHESRRSSLSATLHRRGKR